MEGIYLTLIWVGTKDFCVIPNHFHFCYKKNRLFGWSGKCNSSTSPIKMAFTIVSSSIFPFSPIKVSHYCPAYKYFPIDSFSSGWLHRKKKREKSEKRKALLDSLFRCPRQFFSLG